MIFWLFIFRSLRFHARAHLAVVLGAAIGSAVLMGALLVGDSVRYSLHQQSVAAVGPFDFALISADRFFQQRLEVSLPSHLLAGPTQAMPRVTSLLLLPGTAIRPDATARANQIQVLGVSPEFFSLAKANSFSGLTSPETFLNPALAAQLAARPGDELLVRIPQPGTLAREVPMMSREGTTTTLRLRVAGVLSSEQAGNFSLQRRGTPPLNLFVPRAVLARAAALEDRANVLLVSSPGAERDEGTVLGQLKAALRQSWSLADLDLESRRLTNSPALELRSPRVFLEPALLPAAQQACANSQPLLTYLANLIRAGTNQTPYSLVTAAGPPYTPVDLAEDEILLSAWLAEDLHVQPGQSVELSYFLPESGAQLLEATNRFRVRAILPNALPWADPTLLPEFPGIAKAERAGDWDGGFPLTYKIRPKDEAYWKQYRGTPKAFISLRAGQRLWANRFGAATAVRFAVTNTPIASEPLEQQLLAHLSPESFGLRFEPIRAQALQAANQAQDFGQLFLGFSCFLVVAALLLVGLLFQFGLEQRVVEVGTLLALGFSARQVRRWLLAEAALLALAGGLLGALAGFGYARSMLWGLTTLWRAAVGPAELHFHATLSTVLIGSSAGIGVALLTLWLALHRMTQRPARALLAGESQSGQGSARPTRRLWLVAGAAGVGAMSLVAWQWMRQQTANPETFFTAGTLLLVSGLAATAAWLRVLEQPTSASSSSFRTLGVRGCARRRYRSLSTVTLLAGGSFVLLAVSVFRLGAAKDPANRRLGTGGFALVGETTLPIYQDLNSPSGRQDLDLNSPDLANLQVVPLRVRDGDEASCLNLHRAQSPRLLGVRPELLAGRFTFAKTAAGLAPRQGWELLRTRTLPPSDRPLSLSSAGGEGRGEEAVVPAIGDAGSIEWALGKRLGDTLDYTDAQGRSFQVRLVGALANSLLQGSLLIDEAEFVKRFPNQSGYRMFLVDAPAKSAAAVSATLTRALRDEGLQLTPATRRLEAFNAVQNTYLGTFQVLGGLGLLLGSAGLGVVVLRNVLERRGELALLLAMGFSRPAVQRVVLLEHLVLLVLGLGLGLTAALVAVLPQLLTATTPLPYRYWSLTLLAVLLNGTLWTYAATRYALRGNLLSALRNE